MGMQKISHGDKLEFVLLLAPLDSVHKPKSRYDGFEPLLKSEFNPDLYSNTYNINDSFLQFRPITNGHQSLMRTTGRTAQ
jgi:hypothetical protein